MDMLKTIVLSFFLFSTFCAQASSIKIMQNVSQEAEIDSNIVGELNQYWHDLSRTVREGDFEGYASLYHDDAVVVFGAGANKRSVSIAKALKGWKQGFEDTKAGKANSNVNFRISQRIYDEDTAHESGIFHYTSKDKNGDSSVSQYVKFEMLLVKKEGKWLGLMEYQRDAVSKEDWDTLEAM